MRWQIHLQMRAIAQRFSAPVSSIRQLAEIAD
jgi:hypothetical protein